MRRARKQRPSAFLGAECNSGTTEKPRGRETRQAPVPTGAGEIEVTPSGLCVSLLRPLLGLIAQVTHAWFAGDATTAHTPKQLLIYCLTGYCCGKSSWNASNSCFCASTSLQASAAPQYSASVDDRATRRNVSTAHDQAAPAHKLTQPVVDRASAVSANLQCGP
jgi:hypothetical protein